MHPDYSQQSVQLAEDPNEALSTAGLILAIIIPPIGLIISIVSLLKSHRGTKNSLALTGCIIGGVLTLMVSLVIVTLIATINRQSQDASPDTATSSTGLVSPYSGIQKRAKTSEASATANSILKYTEVYNALTGTAQADNYPKSIAQMKTSGYAEIPADHIVGIQATKPLTSAPSEPSTFEFYTCTTKSGDGNKVGTWNYSTNTVDYVYAGLAGANSTCTFVAN